jgi:hypothetical protein
LSVLRKIKIFNWSIFKKYKFIFIFLIYFQT